MQVSPSVRAHPDDLMLSYKEYDNAQRVEIVLKGRVATESSTPSPTSSKPSSSATGNPPPHASLMLANLGAGRGHRAKTKGRGDM